MSARGGVSARARGHPCHPQGHPGSRKVPLDLESLQELFLLEGKTIRKTGTGTGCTQGASPWREPLDHRRQESPAWLPTLSSQQLQGAAAKGPPRPGLGSGSSPGRVNLAPAPSAPSALVKLRALAGASKAERLCSSQGRELRELQEMELMPSLKGNLVSERNKVINTTQGV